MQPSLHEATFSAEELCTLFNLEQKINNQVSISTDSRTIKSNQVFLPLVGQSFDGHDFINDVLNKSVKLAFCEEKQINKVKEQYRDKLIIVENAIETYHKIANYYRNKINPTVIAITGSAGKTTCKELISRVLSSVFKVHSTSGNFNNEFGVPKTMLEMPTDTEILVLELAMRAKDEIKLLSKVAEPDIAIITNIGTSHIGRLGSIQAIREAKSEIFEHLRSKGLAVLPNDEKLLEAVKNIWRGKTASFDISQANDISFKDGKTYFSMDIKGLIQENYHVSATGKTHVLNSLISILIGKYLGLSKAEVQKGLSNFEIPEGRGKSIKVASDIYVIDETYNASTDSVKAAVENLINGWNGNYKKCLVLGELAELGEQEENLIKELGSWLKKEPLSKVVTVGNQFKKVLSGDNVTHTNNKEECYDTLKQMLQPNTVFLIKGSRVAELDKVVKLLTNKKENDTIKNKS